MSFGHVLVCTNGVQQYCPGKVVQGTSNLIEYTCSFPFKQKKESLYKPFLWHFLYICSIIDMKDDTWVSISNSMRTMLFQISRNLKWSPMWRWWHLMRKTPMWMWKHWTGRPVRGIPLLTPASTLRPLRRSVEPVLMMFHHRKFKVILHQRKRLRLRETSMNQVPYMVLQLIQMSEIFSTKLLNFI